MKRLTERFSNGQAAVFGCGNNCKYDYKYCYSENGNCPTLEEIYEKLAFYEDLEEKGELPIIYGVNVYPLRQWLLDLFYEYNVKCDETIEELVDDVEEIIEDAGYTKQ